MGMFDKLFSGRADQTYIKGTGWQSAPKSRPPKKKFDSPDWKARDRPDDNWPDD